MSDSPVTAKIAVAVSTYWTDQLYDYTIPDSLAGLVRPGVRVSVPYGKGNRRTEGIVFSVGAPTSERICKNISAVLDAEPVLSGEMLSLAVWMRRRYFCTVYDAVHAILPAGLWYRMEVTFALAEGVDREKAFSQAENEAERLIAEAVFSHGGVCPLEDLKTLFDGAEPSKALQSLIRKGVLQPDSRNKRRIGDKARRMVILAVTPAEAEQAARQKERRSAAMAQSLRILASVERMSASELTSFTGISPAALRSLEKSELVKLSEEEVFRRPAQDSIPHAELPVLNEEQQAAFEGILALCDEGKPSASLLYGVTGSGKTSVYIHLIDAMWKRGKSAILMVPEISLTPQMIRIFSSHFGDSVAVLHSSLSVGERYDEWKRIRNGDARLVIGTRSAVFAPAENLGLVLMDEEQEYTYKSENVPRYHAREIAKFRLAACGGHLVLGSATPDLETRYLAETGRCHAFTLRSRYNARALPRVSVVDMKEELRCGCGGDLSRRLLDELAENISRGEQSILFLNRRGTSSLIACGECGYTYSCPNCSVHLTWHASNRRLVCHHCGFTRRLDEHCPECGGILNHFGTGTQRLEEELHQHFPDTEILRMDADAVSPVGSHEKLLTKFRERKIPILVGTQMVTKGLDFENVTLVGVISADQLLYCGDYRSGERTFSLITQVVGRSGRGSKPGRAIIQTFTPENQIIHLAARQDYERFYAQEIRLRELQYCPPFADIVTITASGAMESDVLRCCVYIRDICTRELKGRGDIRILGPAPLPVVRVNNRYRYRVSLHGKFDKEIRELTSGILNCCNTVKEFKGVSVYADLNPME